MMKIFGALWFSKIIIHTAVLTAIFIMEFLWINYSASKTKSQTANIVINSDIKNVEDFLLRSYYKSKNSPKYGVTVLISMCRDREQEKICEIFSAAKDIMYIKI